MKIVMFSINPLFPDRVMGGAPKHLQNIAVCLGRQGHQVEILATRRSPDQESFYWHPNVRVLPKLRFKQPFPQPYAIPAYDTAAGLQAVAEHLEKADRFYMHDGEFLFPYAYRELPTVISLRDNVYPETLLGGFLFNGDALIAISDYSRQFYLSTFGRFFPGLKERTVVIPNGIDWQVFQPTQPVEILERIPVDPDQHTIIVHPHRPESSKGLLETIGVADRLVHRHGIDNLRVLVPRWLDTNLSLELQNYYAEIRIKLQQRGLEEHFIFHEWVPQQLMPQYYSLGGVTLSLGHFVEAFGNAVYESLGCGTPAVVARVSTHRELLPDDLLAKVHYGDLDSAAELAASILHQRQRTAPETIAYLREHYSIEQQLTAYSRVILDTPKLPPLAYQLQQVSDHTSFRLSPWCYAWEGGFFHDFLGHHVAIPELTSLLRRYPAGFTWQQAAQLGLPRQKVENWYLDGWLVPQDERVSLPH